MSLPLWKLEVNRFLFFVFLFYFLFSASYFILKSQVDGVVDCKKDT